MKKFIGIDPGGRGAISVLTDVVGVSLTEASYLYPFAGNTLDIQVLRELFQQLCQYEAKYYCCIEDVHAFPWDTPKTGFGLGRNFGILETLISELGIPVTYVSPAKWQKVMWEGVPKQDKPKNTSLIAAKRLFPKNDFLPSPRHKVPHDGIVDSLLIAAYCRRLHYK